jgi:hypothetical protein
MHVVSSVARQVVLNDKHDNVSIAFTLVLKRAYMNCSCKATDSGKNDCVS